MFGRRVEFMLCCLGAAMLTDAAVKLDDFVTPCSLKDPKLDECLTTQGRAMLPHLVAGIREWGVLPLDPLFVPLMQLQRNEGGSIGIAIEVINSSHYGWKDMQIESIKMDPKNYKFDVNWVFPKYTMLGEGETSGRIILLPISGKGAANMTFLDVHSTMTANCVPEEKEGKMYLNVTDVKVANSPKKLIMKLDNLFNNKQLSDSMNKVLNDNSLDIFEELKPNVDAIFSEIVFSLLSRMFAKIPLNQLLADVE